MSKSDFQVRNMSEEININCLLNIYILLTIHILAVFSFIELEIRYVANFIQAVLHYSAFLKLKEQTLVQIPALRLTMV